MDSIHWKEYFCERYLNNVYGSFAIKVVKDDETVGHASRMISNTVKYIIPIGGNI